LFFQFSLYKKLIEVDFLKKVIDIPRAITNKQTNKQTNKMPAVFSKMLLCEENYPIPYLNRKQAERLLKREVLRQGKMNKCSGKKHNNGGSCFWRIGWDWVLNIHTVTFYNHNDDEYYKKNVVVSGGMNYAGF